MDKLSLYAQEDSDLSDSSLDNSSSSQDSQCQAP